MSTGDDRVIELYRRQFEFVNCEDRFTAFVAGVGSGKTFAGAVKLLYLSSIPNQLLLVVAPTYSMLRDSTYRSIVDVFGNGIIYFNKAEMRVVVRGGTEILMRSADKPDRLRGPNIHACWMDEAALCPDGTWKIVIGRLRADGGAGPCFLTSTPKGRNWLYELSSRLKIFKASTSDNPYLDPEFVKSLEQYYTGKFAEQELHGAFVGFEGLVYENFQRNLHVCEREEKWNRVVIGVDEGYTNPAVLLVIGEDSDGRLHIIEEYYKRQMLRTQMAKVCKELVETHHVDITLVDPSSAGLIAEMRGMGIKTAAANNTVSDGIQRVKTRFVVAGDGRPRLTVSLGCANTISELESYAWKETGGIMKDVPEKINDHAMDALRYAVMYFDGKRGVFVG